MDIQSRAYKKLSQITQAICSATLIEDNKILFADGSNKTTINDFKKVIEKLDTDKEVNYTIDDNKILFYNGSIIEIYQTERNNIIRSPRAKLSPEYYDYDATYFDEEEFNKIVSKFENK